eukprot:943258_1
MLRTIPICLIICHLLLMIKITSVFCSLASSFRVPVSQTRSSFSSVWFPHIGFVLVTISLLNVHVQSQQPNTFEQIHDFHPMIKRLMYCSQDIDSPSVFESLIFIIHFAPYVPSKNRQKLSK